MRLLLVPLVAAALLAVPAPAFAADPCPPGLRDTTGTEPTDAQVASALHDAAVEHDVPEVLLRAIAYVESDWTQFVDGKVLVSSDTVCGVGIMQVTADGRADAQDLASSYTYNIREGAEILRAKYDLNAGSHPDGYGPDDPDVVENWYYALCLYNGCGTDPTYPDKVVRVVVDPFRYAPNFAPLDPYWFTRPQDAQPGYTLPSPFQAQYAPTQQFVFYDAGTGDISSTVPIATHLLGTTPPPSITYPAGVYGPDGARVTCAQCGGWRLASGAGLIGRAHWTNTVSGPAQSSMTWQPLLPRTGPYRVAAFVPSLAEGVARYSVDGVPVTVDQGPLADVWANLGDHTLASGDTVVLTDHAEAGDPLGVPIAGDAVRFSGITALSLTVGAGTLTYGSSTSLTARLTHGGFAVGGFPLRLFKRAVGTTAWTGVGTYTTSSTGYVTVPVKPSANAEYTVRFYAPTPAYTDASVGVRRVLVRPRIGASVSGRTISALVAPDHRSRRIYLQRLTSSGWQNVTSALLSSASRASFTVSRAGSYRLLLPAHTDHTTGTSATLSVR